MRALRLSPAGLLFLAVLTAAAATLSQPALVSMQSEDEVPVAAAWAPDGQRLAYGIEKRIERRRPPVSVGEDTAVYYPGEAWVTDFAAKPKRVLKYDLLRTPEGEFLNFTVDRLAWSPDGRRLLVEVSDEKKQTATFFFTAQGDRVKLGSSPFNFVPGYGGAWLGDGETVALLSEASAPRLLHRIHVVRVAGGRDILLFRERTFAGIAWLPQAHKAALVERDPEFRRVPKLWVGNLDTGELTPLADLPDYIGRLQATPDERRVSYFVGQEKLAVREIAPDSAVEILPIPFGRYEWAGGAVLYLEAKELGAKTGWLTLYDPQTKTRQRLLPDELLYNFWVSAGGERVAVLTVGPPPQLKVYRLAP